MKPASRRPAAPVPTVTYPPGHFTASISRHNWPPMFESKYRFDTLDLSAISSKARNDYVRRTGNTGTIGGLNGNTTLVGDAARRKVLV